MSWPRGVWAVGVVVGLLWLLLLWSVAKDVVCPSLMLMMAAQIKILIVLYIWIKEKLMDTAWTQQLHLITRNVYVLYVLLVADFLTTSKHSGRF